jgi:hypothetical protein
MTNDGLHGDHEDVGHGLAAEVALLEGTGFELVWGFFLSSGCFRFIASSLFGAEGPFFIPSPAIRFPERAEAVKGPKR